MRVVSDGEYGMRSMAGKWFNANEQHILDGITSHGGLNVSEKASFISLMSRISNTGCQDTGST